MCSVYLTPNQCGYCGVWSVFVYCYAHLPESFCSRVPSASQTFFFWNDFLSSENIFVRSSFPDGLLATGVRHVLIKQNLYFPLNEVVWPVLCDSRLTALFSRPRKGLLAEPSTHATEKVAVRVLSLLGLCCLQGNFFTSVFQFTTVSLGLCLITCVTHSLVFQFLESLFVLFFKLIVFCF